MALTKIQVNCETGVTEEIELTEEELAQMESDQLLRLAEEQAIEDANLAKAAAKASALAKLEALGLTPEEAAAL
jgi:hypothetical protein